LTAAHTRLRILEDLAHHSASAAAAAALLVLSGCATGGAQLTQDVSSLKAEVRTLRRENDELLKRLDAMSTQIDLLAARAARPAAPPAPAAGTVGAVAGAVASVDTGLQVPANLKVVKLEPARPSQAPKGAKPGVAPPVPTSTPIQDPSTAALDRARALAGLPRARALEEFADAHPASTRSGEALVDAARTRKEAGDPDGACEDFSRAVAEYPTSRAAPDALEGLAACELRRGRVSEANRLQARLAKDFPDSPAGKRASEHAPAVQGAAP
jgi:TolA-binding protein